MRARTLTWVAGLLVMVGLAACTQEVEDEPDEVVEEPTPELEPTPTVPPADPFDLTLTDLAWQTLANDPLFGRTVTEPDQEAVDQAAAEAGAALQDYLNRQFVDPATRFSLAPAEDFLTGEAQAALADDQHEGLGVLDLSGVAGTETGTASARPVVLIDGADARLVSLTYEATFTVIHEDGTTTPLTQWGTVLVTPTEEGWKARAMDVEVADGHGAASEESDDDASDAEDG